MIHNPLYSSFFTLKIKNMVLLFSQFFIGLKALDQWKFKASSDVYRGSRLLLSMVTVLIYSFFYGVSRLSFPISSGEFLHCISPPKFASALTVVIQ